MTTSDRCSNAESEGLAQVMESYARLLKTQLEGDHVGLAADTGWPAARLLDSMTRSVGSLY